MTICGLKECCYGFLATMVVIWYIFGIEVIALQFMYPLPGTIGKITIWCSFLDIFFRVSQLIDWLKAFAWWWWRIEPNPCLMVIWRYVYYGCGVCSNSAMWWIWMVWMFRYLIRAEKWEIMPDRGKLTVGIYWIALTFASNLLWCYAGLILIKATPTPENFILQLNSNDRETNLILRNRDDGLVRNPPPVRPPPIRPVPAGANAQLMLQIPLINNARIAQPPQPAQPARIAQPPQPVRHEHPRNRGNWLDNRFNEPRNRPGQAGGRPGQQNNRFNEPRNRPDQVRGRPGQARGRQGPLDNRFVEPGNRPIHGFPPPWEPWRLPEAEPEINSILLKEAITEIENQNENFDLTNFITGNKSYLTDLKWRDTDLRMSEVIRPSPEQTRRYDSDNECLICYGQIEQTEEVMIHPGCHHKFHRSCLLGWFKTRPVCPKCNRLTREHMLRDLRHSVSYSQEGYRDL